MDPDSRQGLTRLLSTQRVAAMGTLRDGAPYVSLVPFVVAANAAAFHIHISRLAQHTLNILSDPRVGLLIAETDRGAGDPQTLARISIEGEAIEMALQDPDYAPAKARYLTCLPEAAFNFGLADFSLFRIVPSRARYVAGFGRIFNLTGEELMKLAGEALTA